MSVTFEVRQYSYGWRDTGWYYKGNGEPCYIADRSMTEFRFTPGANLRQITISFKCRNDPGVDYDGECYYSLTYPETGPSSPGTRKASVPIGANSITIEGSFTAGNEYHLWVWGVGGYWPVVVIDGQTTGSGEEFVDDGLARVYSGGAWGKYEARIWSGGAWTQYEPYVYYNGAWRKMA